MNMKHLYTSLSSGTTSGSVTDNSIQNDSVIEIYYDNGNCYTESSSQSGHTVYFNVGGNTVGTNVCVVVNNLSNFTPYNDTNVQEHLQDLDGDVADINEHFDIIDGYLDEIDETLSNHSSTLSSHSSEIINLQLHKQDTLTPGDNITIENNVISASGGGAVPVMVYEGSIRNGNITLLQSIENYNFICFIGQSATDNYVANITPLKVLKEFVGSKGFGIIFYSTNYTYCKYVNSTTLNFNNPPSGTTWNVTKIYVW